MECEQRDGRIHITFDYPDSARQFIMVSTITMTVFVAGLDPILPPVIMALKYLHSTYQRVE